MDRKSMLWIVLFCAFFSKLFAANCNNERKCKTAHVLGLKTSDCFSMEWKEIPKCLPSDVEVIELSYNRIRKISNSDFERYSYITHLYLDDNSLVNLDDDIFKDLTSLETLDLSLNSLGTVPPVIFHLPKLKTLYLSQNLHFNIAQSIEEAKPIPTSRLTKLDISYITGEGSSTDFPDFGELPYLAFLNITGDQFNYLTTRHFAGLCNLQILANVNVTAEFKDKCDCWKINQWLKERKVDFTSLLCPINENECLDQQLNEEDLDVYQTCRQKFYQIERNILLGKIGIGIAIAIGFIILLVVVCLYKRWKRNQRRGVATQVQYDSPQSLQPLNKHARA